MMWSVRDGDELYIVRNGDVIYKKWYRHKTSKLFSHFTHGDLTKHPHRTYKADIKPDMQR